MRTMGADCLLQKVTAHLLLSRCIGVWSRVRDPCLVVATVATTRGITFSLTLLPPGLAYSVLRSGFSSTAHHLARSSLRGKASCADGRRGGLIA